MNQGKMGEEVAATIQVRDIGTWREEGSKADSGSIQAVEGEVREREGSRKATLLQLCSKDQHSTWRLVGQAESRASQTAGSEPMF